MLPTSPAQVRAVLEKARQPRTREELQAAAGLGHRQHFVQEYLNPLLASGWLTPTIPDKPRSPKQRYRLTPLGQAELSRLLEEKN